MKIEHRLLTDGRLSLSLTENDGTAIATRELSRDEAVNLFAQWAARFVPTTGQQHVVLEGRDKDIVITLVNHSPRPSEESAADGEQQDNQ